MEIRSDFALGKVLLAQALARMWCVTYIGSTEVPEVNQLVRVRDRNYLVSNVVGSPFDGTSAITGNSVSSHPRSHLITLQSVDDYGQQEELSVIWEVEPGTKILETATLPNPQKGRFDDPDKMEAFLNALRWGAVTSADSNSFQSPFRSGINIEEYQLEPVVRALSRPRVNLLIADDVGLGKTIEAGLVIHELILRHRARKVMIICPATLTVKWYEEMLEKFGLEFTVVDSSFLKELRRTRGINANPFKIFPRTIVSMDWIKESKARRLLDDVISNDQTPYPREFDVLVVDEVHHFAPKSGTEDYAVDTLRTKLIRRIAPHFEHRLFLSATPHNGHEYSFRSLLSLLDSQRFTPKLPPERTALDEVMIRRLKRDIKNSNGENRFATREVEPIEIHYTDDEIRVQCLLDEYIQLRKGETRDAVGKGSVELVLLLLKKRLFSSPAAFASTLECHIESLKNQKGSGVSRSPRNYEFIDLFDGDLSDDESQEDAENISLEVASANIAETSESQWEILDELKNWSVKMRRKADSKAEAVIRWIEDICIDSTSDRKKVWNNERVILFTEYRDTQHYLYELLKTCGLGDRLALLNGDTDQESREKIKGEFQHEPEKFPLRIILATDAASEGIDLQRYCHRMLHIEIPFSPTKLEQRIGRIDRHGQRSPIVTINHFVSAGWKDEFEVYSKRDKWNDMRADFGILSLMAKKIATIDEDLGSVSTMLAAEMSNFLTGNRTSELKVLRSDYRPESTIVRAKRDSVQAAAEIRKRLDESITELHVHPENVLRATQVALELANQPKLSHVTIKDSNGEIEAYKVPEFTRSWASALIGLKDPLTKEDRLLVFDPKQLGNRNDLIYAHLNNPIVAQSLRTLRANIWASDADARISRVTCRYIESNITDEIYIVAHGRLVVFGDRGTRLHEEVISSGGRLRDGRFRRFDSLTQMRQILESALFERCSGEIEDFLVSEWDKISEPLFQSLEVRANDRASSLQVKLTERSKLEAKEIEGVLNELATLLESAVKQYDDEYFALFQEDYKLARQRDLEQVKARLEKIPSEIVAEKASILQRYSEMFYKNFPAAVEVLVPRGFKC